MQRTKYAPGFKDGAVKQVIVRGHSVVDVAKRLGIPQTSQPPAQSVMAVTGQALGHQL